MGLVKTIDAERTLNPRNRPWRLSRMQRRLAVSLSCYCSDDDRTLSRAEFLEAVRDRITADIDEGLFGEFKRRKGDPI